MQRLKLLWIGGLNVSESDEIKEALEPIPDIEEPDIPKKEKKNYVKDGEFETYTEMVDEKLEEEFDN